MAGRWGAEGPPEEAYGRTTDVARFAVLHDIGHQLLDDLERRYDVTRTTTSEPDSHSDVEAAVVTLVPADPRASALTLVFDAFPGLLVRYGSRGATHEPVCGCDACDEDVESCVARMTDRIDAVVSGSFGERDRVDGARLAELRQALPEPAREGRPWGLRVIAGSG
jgi:hypothetical protein